MQTYEQKEYKDCNITSKSKKQRLESLVKYYVLFFMASVHKDPIARVFQSTDRREDVQLP